MSAIIPYLQPGAITNAQSDITDLQALSGMPDNSLNLGTFTGDTIPDSQTTKQALQALETEVEDRLADFVQWSTGTGPGYRFDGSDDRITTTDFPFGTNDFTVVLQFSHRDLPTAFENMVRNGTGNNRFSIGANVGKYTIGFVDNSGTGVVAGDINVSQSTLPQSAVFVFDRDGDCSLYLNGEYVGATDISAASGVDLSLNTDAYSLGNSSLSFDGTFYAFRVINRAVTEAEAQLLSRGQSLGFADEGADGSASYTSDFSAGVDGWTTGSTTLDGNIDAIGGEDDTLRVTIQTTGTNGATKSGIFTVGKRYRLTGRFFIPSSNSHVDGIRFSTDAGTNIGGDFTSPTLDAWNDVSFEFVAGTTFTVAVALDGGSNSINDPGNDDVYYLKDIVVTPIGEVLRLTGNGAAPTIWADESGNGYNGTVTGATLIYQRALHADSFVSLTNLPTSSAGLATGQVWNDSGTLKIV